MSALHALPTPVEEPEPETLILDTVVTILADAIGVVTSLNGAPIAEHRTDKAEQTRTVLHLADSLNLASSIVRNEYWHGKGMTSYDV